MQITKKARRKQIYPSSIAKVINESPWYVAIGTKDKVFTYYPRCIMHRMPFVVSLHRRREAACCCSDLSLSLSLSLSVSPLYIYPTNGIIFRRFTTNDKDEWIIYAPLDAMVFALASYANKLPCELTRRLE